MAAIRTGLAVALASSLACATGAPGTRRHVMPPPARDPGAGSALSSGVPTRPSEPLSPAPPPDARPQPGGDVARALEAASSLVGRRTIVLDGIDYGSGCTALVRAAFAHAGHPLPPTARDAAAVLAVARERGALTGSRQPAAGDLVFLADRPGGPAAHVGIVAHIDPDGTALVLHRVVRGVLRVRMNLAYPSRPTDPATGKHINDTLVVNARGVTAGSLVVGVSDLLRHG